MSIQSVNPATGEIIETLEETSKTQIEQALARAHAAFLEWRTRPFADRARLMRAAAARARRSTPRP
jgi:succinate-semialdehyde dehydrogenase/glutarate-semialdehyde dehydrogenase